MYVRSSIRRTKCDPPDQICSNCKSPSAAKNGIENATKQADPSITVGVVVVLSPMLDTVDPLHRKPLDSIRDIGNGKYAVASTQPSHVNIAPASAHANRIQLSSGGFDSVYG